MRTNSDPMSFRKTHCSLHSDRIGIIKKGSIVFLGKADDVMDNTILENVYDKPFGFVKHPDTGTLIIIPEVD